MFKQNRLPPGLGVDMHILGDWWLSDMVYVDSAPMLLPLFSACRLKVGWYVAR